jgi:hypothetical protein
MKLIKNKKLSVDNIFTDKIICLILGVFALISRLPLVEQFQSHWDGPQYSVAILRYSFVQQTPAPPGYPLYIAMGRFFYEFISDPHFAILLVSVFATIAGSIVFYIIGKYMYARSVGIVSSILFLTGSTFYYFSLTPYAYIITPVTTAILAFVVHQIYIKHKQYGFLLGVIFGISFGIRPQEAIFTFPLLLLGFIFLSKNEKIKSLVVFSIITLIWLIPVLYLIGPVNFFTQSFEFLKIALIHNSFAQRIELVIKGFLLSFGVSSIFLLYFISKLNKNYLKIIKRNGKIIVFYSIWIIPGLFYNIFLRTEHAGYQMTYLAAFLILISYAIWKITENKKILFVAIMILVAGFNLYWFFYDRDPQFVKPYRPTSFHYSDIRKNDIKTGSKVNFILSQFKPNKTLVITNSVLWRPYGYYLNKYFVISLDGLTDNTPGVLHLERDQQYFDMKQFENQNLSLVVPEGIHFVLLPDDENYMWIKNYSYKIFDLPGNSKITLISVNPGDRIIYKFHYLSVSKLK